jgi:hypothetical protein
MPSDLWNQQDLGFGDNSRHTQHFDAYVKFFCYMHVSAHCMMFTANLAVETVSTMRSIANSIPRKCDVKLGANSISFIIQLGLLQHDSEGTPTVMPSRKLQRSHIQKRHANA